MSLKSRHLFVVALAITTLAGVPSSTAHALAPIKAVSTPTTSAFVQSGIPFNDAPDPAVERFGTKYYVYTTGTEWGNHIGILRSNNPHTGYKTITGTQFGSSAFPSVHHTVPIKSWQLAGRTQAPGVFRWAGKYRMYYAAKSKPGAGHGGRYCLSRASANSPAGPFVDGTTGPWLCMDSECGVIDPHPWSYGGKAYLYFKTYDDDCHTTQNSKIWVVRLSANGLSTVGPKKVMVNQATLPSNTQTVENPQMILPGGQFVLLFSRGNWDSAGYYQSYVICTGPMGPCGAQQGKIIQTYGNVRGPGGGTFVRGLHGSPWLLYHGWQGPNNCTHYVPNKSCIRRLFAAKLNI